MDSLFYYSAEREIILLSELYNSLTSELRKKVLALVNEADQRALRIVNAVFENYEAEEIVAYSIEGKLCRKKII